MHRNTPKISVIGLDGANRKILELMGLDKKGVISNLISTIPPLTPPSWTSILTGVNQGKHGIYGWQNVNMKERKIRLNNSLDVKYPRLFELLGKNNFKSIVVNVPLVYPFDGFSDLKNNIIVTDWASPVQTIYPTKLYGDYKEYFIDPPHEWSNYEDTAGYVRRVYEFLTVRLNLYYRLLEKFDWNLFFIVFSETDWLLHKIPQILEGQKLDLVKPILWEIKKFFYKLMELSDMAFIVSDHGFEIKNLRLSVNTLLKQYNQIKMNTFKSSIFRLAKKVIPNKILEKWAKKPHKKISVSISSVAFEIDMMNSNAFMVEPATWGLFVNRNISNIIKIFKEIPEVKDIIDFHDVYVGPYVEYSPNLVLVPKKGVEFSKSFSNSIYTKIYEGNHEMRGIFLANGDSINNEARLSKIPLVYDITPTILHILGLPLPRDIDGEVLIEIFDENSEFVRRKPMYVNPSYYEKQQEEKRVKRVIRDLKLKSKI